jgi:hypothetical protein
MTEADVVNWCFLAGDWLQCTATPSSPPAIPTVNASCPASRCTRTPEASGCQPLRAPSWPTTAGERIRYPRPTFIGDTIRLGGARLLLWRAPCSALALPASGEAGRLAVRPRNRPDTRTITCFGSRHHERPDIRARNSGQRQFEALLRGAERPLEDRRLEDRVRRDGSGCPTQKHVQLSTRSRRTVPSRQSTTKAIRALAARLCPHLRRCGGRWRYPRTGIDRVGTAVRGQRAGHLPGH